MKNNIPFHSAPVVTFTLAITLLLLPRPAQATLIVEDFSYVDGPTTSGQLSGENGGSGFAGAWGGSTAPQWGIGYPAYAPADSPNLNASVPGYTIEQTGTGQVFAGMGSGVATRALETSFLGSASGTEVWFSMLFNANNNAGRNGLYFDVTGTDRSGAVGGFLMAGDGGALNILDDGVMVATGQSVAAGHINHLVVGKITLLSGSTDSQFQLWIDPTSVTDVLTASSSAAAYSSFLVNFYGSISNIGIENYNNGSIDALRISDGFGDGTTAFYDVVAIPEPSTLALALMGSVLALGRHRRRTDS